MLDYQLLTPSAYKIAVGDLLARLEGFLSRARDIGDGAASIGYGYTFSRSDNLALWQQAGIALTASEQTVLARIDAAPDNATRTAIALNDFTHVLTLAEAKALLGETVGRYEGPADLLGMPLSEERVALVSITYNRGAGAVTLKMGDFLAAVEAGHRAEAWYQIRYESQTALTQFQNGIAKRRYIEAETFGLHDGDVSFAEALSMGRTYAAHRDHILAYEAQWTPESYAGEGLHGIADELRPAIETASARYAQVFNALAEELLVAGPSLRTLNGGAGNDLLIGSFGADALHGGDGRDLLVGRRGGDLLDGGAGADVMDGGAGHDTFVFDDPGDRIVEFAGGGHDTVRIETTGGLRTRHIEVAQVSDPLGAQLTIATNELRAINLSPGRDAVRLVVNRVVEGQDQLVIRTGAGADRVKIVDRLDWAGWSANDTPFTFVFKGIAARDRIDLRPFALDALVRGVETVDGHDGQFLLAPGAELRFDGGALVNASDDWRIADIGADTPWGPALDGDLTARHFLL